MQNHPQEQAGVFEDKAFVSATPLSASANYIMNQPEPFVHTYRTYIKLTEQGRLTLKFWHSNNVDSTWDLGKEATGSEPGGPWTIESAYFADGGTEPDGTAKPGSEVQLTFGGQVSRAVLPGETFWSDEAELTLPEGHLLAFTWTLRTEAAGKSVPYNVEGMLASGYDAAGNRAGQSSAEGFALSDKLLVMPAYIGYKKPGVKKLVFLGDSITQGVRTPKDEYGYWAARIAAGLGSSYGIWNIGSGWARAYDASADGAWLNKAKQGDEILIVLGVNDLDIGQRTDEELLGDLTAIIGKLKEANPQVRVILGTVPPFNFAGGREVYWRSVNERLLSAPPAGTDSVFDIASVLAVPAPDDHRIRPEYMSAGDDPHPNSAAGAAVAEAFLAWYSKQQ